MTSLLSFFGVSMLIISISPTLSCANDFDVVAVGDRVFLPLALGDNRVIKSNRHAFSLRDIQMPEHLPDRELLRLKRLIFAIYDKVHRDFLRFTVTTHP